MPDKRPAKVITPLLIAILFYLSFSKLNLWFFIFPALFLLLSSKDWRLWLFSGFLSFFFSLLWIRIAMIDYGEVLPPLAYALILLLASFLSLMQFGITYLLWRSSGFKPFLLPFFWSLTEVLRANFPYGGFPWLLLGELSVDIPFFKYYLSAGGVYLGSLLLWTPTLIPFLRRNLRYFILILALFLVPLPFLKTEAVVPEGLKVALVQPNVDESIKLDTKKFYEYLPHYWELLDKALEQKPDLVILPESAFPFTANQLYSRGDKLLKYSKEAVIVTGLIDIRQWEGFKPYNSVFVLKDGKVVDFYDKVRLLPFGEYVPFPFGFVKSIFGAIAGTDYTPGDGVRCLKVDGIKLATPICFEVSYYHLVKDFAECGELIAVLTNDGWFRDSDGTYQHLRQARVRALETRRYVLWVNNTGPSAVISPDGRILKKIEYGKKGYIIFTFPSSIKVKNREKRASQSLIVQG